MLGVGTYDDGAERDYDGVGVILASVTVHLGGEAPGAAQTCVFTSDGEIISSLTCKIQRDFSFQIFLNSNILEDEHLFIAAAK